MERIVKIAAKGLVLCSDFRMDCMSTTLTIFCLIVSDLRSLGVSCTVAGLNRLGQLKLMSTTRAGLI